MRREELAAVVRKDPFRRFELIMENGERHRITHPESIWLTEHIVCLVDASGDLSLIDYASISEVRVPSRRNGNGRKR